MPSYAMFLLVRELSQQSGTICDVNGMSSSKQKIKFGVRQGSVFGLCYFCFTLMTSVLVCRHTHPMLYVDDTN